MGTQVGISYHGKHYRMPRKIAVLAACDEAETHLLAAGFVLRWQSGKSEARYYSGLGRSGTIRIASHAVRYKNAGFGMDNMKALGPVVAAVTFPEACADKNGNIELSREAIEFKVATAIGLYAIRAQRNNGQ